MPIRIPIEDNKTYRLLISYTEPRLFEKLLKQCKLDTGSYPYTMGKIYHHILYKGNETNIQQFDIVLKYYKITEMDMNLIWSSIKLVHLDMVKRIYSIRRPNKFIFESSLVNIIKEKREDLFQYLISIAPYDINIIEVLIKDGSLDMFKTYTNNIPLNNDAYLIWKHVVRNDRLDIAKWLYQISYNCPSYDYETDNKTYRWLCKKNICNIM